MSLPTTEQVYDVLREVDDPEIGINIVDLGLIYGVSIADADIYIKMTMTTPACPLHSYLSKASQEAIRKHFPDVNAVNVELVWIHRGSQPKCHKRPNNSWDGGRIPNRRTWSHVAISCVSCFC